MSGASLRSNGPSSSPVEPRTRVDSTGEREAIKRRARCGITELGELVERDEIVSRHDELFVTARFDEGRLIGYIDHLIVTEDTYYVVDFKPSDTSENSPDELCERYWSQLEVYATILNQSVPTAQ